MSLCSWANPESDRDYDISFIPNPFKWRQFYEKGDSDSEDSKSCCKNPKFCKWWQSKSKIESDEVVQTDSSECHTETVVKLK